MDIQRTLSKRSAIAALVLSVAASTASAHHSFAMFDHDNQVKLKGTVTNFQWTNPHVYIAMDVPEDAGSHKTWTIEAANPGILNRVGWKFNMIKPGDEITVIVAPLRTGEPGALLKQVTLADGRSFTNGVPAGAANIQ